MSFWIEIRRFPANTDLSDVNAFLVDRGVEHLFTEEGSEQVLWLADETEREAVCEFVNRYLQGGIEIDRKGTPKKLISSSDLISFILKSPVTVALVVLGFLGYAAMDIFRSHQAFNLLSFWPLERAIGNVQVWRLVSPAFLHFGLGHIVLNVVWIIILGRRLESLLGSKHYLVFACISGFGGNLLQFYLGGHNQFGGLSGIVFGLFGAFIVGHWLFKNKLFLIPNALLVMTLISLFLGFSGFFDLFSSLSIGNWAHLGGLLFGAAYIALLLRWQRR